MPALYVGIWSCNTRDEAWMALSLEARIEKLGAAVAQAGDKLVDLAATATARDVGWLFVAPEYLFDLDLASREVIDYRFMQIELEAKTALRAALRDLTKPERNKALLLIPGSVAFRRPLQGEKEDLERAKKRIRKMWGQLKVHDQAYKELADHVKEIQLQADQERHEGKMKLFKAACLAALKEDSLKSVSIARNTAYGYWRGDKVFAYHKRGEVGEIDPRYDTETTFINGGPTDCTRDGVLYGVEICKDAVDGYLKHVARKTVDVQVVLSASVSWAEITKSAKSYVIHACQLEENSGVSHVTSGRKDPFARQKCEGYGLSYYKLEL